MTDLEHLDGESDYARCPECSQVLMSNGDGTFSCISPDTNHGPYRLYYEEVQDSG